MREGALHELCVVGHHDPGDVRGVAQDINGLRSDIVREQITVLLHEAVDRRELIALEDPRRPNDRNFSGARWPFSGNASTDRTTAGHRQGCFASMRAGLHPQSMGQRQ